MAKDAMLRNQLPSAEPAVVNLSPLISVIKHELAMLAEVTIPQQQIGPLGEWELENVLEAFVVKMTPSLSPSTFFPSHSFPPSRGRAEDRVILVVSWRPPQERKSALLAELLIF